MADRLLRITIEGTFGMPHELAKKTIDILKYKNGEYWYKYTRLNESLGKEVIKKRTNKNKIDKMLKILSEIEIPAFPQHQMGCDGGFTEIEIGDYEGKSHFRWWSVPPTGWEKLDEITQRIISDMNIKDA